MTQTAKNFLPTSMPAHRSMIAGIMDRSLAGARQRLPVYKLFCEPKLIPGYVPRRPNQVHLRGFHHHYAERLTCSSATIFPQHCWRFHSPGWPKAMRGSSAAKTLLAADEHGLTQIEAS